MFESLSYDEVIERKLGVMDTNAIVLCRDQHMPIRVFNVFGNGNLMQIVQGKKVGTIIS
jgi:uridylate kinase